jgi:two-component system, OmpR family, KDP operon response regulator KdpE
MLHRTLERFHLPIVRAPSPCKRKRVCRRTVQEDVATMAFSSKLYIVSPSNASAERWAFPQLRLSILVESDPGEALRHWMDLSPDLILLDLDTAAPALEFIARLREETTVPILLLSALWEEQFLLQAYEAGVDEFIPRPVSPELLQAKLKAWLRRVWNVPVDLLDPLRVGPLYLDPSRRLLERAGLDPVHLTNLELRLLYYLMGRPGRTLTAEELCQRVWAPTGEGDLRTLKNLVYRLRHKIEDDPARPGYIRTISGVGYQFVPW